MILPFRVRAAPYPNHRVAAFPSPPRLSVSIIVTALGIIMNTIAPALLALACLGTTARVADAGPSATPTSMSSGGVRVVLQGNELKPPARIYFATNSDGLLPASEPALLRLQAFLTERSDISLLRIEVHSDARGSHAYNQAFTEKRALAVARALVARGVDCRRLLPVGFGETRPIVPNNAADLVEVTRRVSLVVAALQGRPVGSEPVDGGGHSAGDPCN